MYRSMNDRNIIHYRFKMKIPARFGFLINYHAGDNLDGLKHSINHKAQSALVRLWNKVMQKIPVLGLSLIHI